MQLVDLPFMRAVVEPGSHIEHVYFPEDCVLSLFVVAETGEAVETATIGKEGAFGLVAGLHSREAYPRCLVQVAGKAYRVAASELQREFDRSAQVRRVIMSYIEILLIQTHQSALCNALHPTRARLARWLAVMHDRADKATIPLTQEFLAGILGVGRTSVTAAARALRKKDIISYRRGVLKIKRRSELEVEACECYRTLRRELERLLPPAQRSPLCRSSTDKRRPGDDN
jgi:CRP-like cAMP-binding protein